MSARDNLREMLAVLLRRMLEEAKTVWAACDNEPGTPAQRDMPAWLAGVRTVRW